MNAETTFGQVVRAHRREKGLTQEELAHRVGCAAVTLRKIEHDNLRPSVQIAERLAVALNIPTEERLNFVRLARLERKPFLDPSPSSSPGPEEIGLEDLSGRFLRGYALGARIGSGGFGAVYRAVQPTVGRDVAVKIVLPQYANNPEFIRHFEAEAQFVARLEHPHIVPLYDYWREPNIACLVMRLLRGGSVQDLLQNGPLSPETTLRILEQVSSALAAAHRAGVVHRDLKPANILLDDDENAYLADFGIAKHLSSPLKDAERWKTDVSFPQYFAPEQIRAEFVQPQTDIYSLGVMIYELLTGAAPYRGPTPIDTMHQHLTAPMPSLAANRSGLPKALDEVIQHATAKDPFQRYESVESLLDDFRRAISVDWKVKGMGTTYRVPPSTTVLTAADNPYKGLRAFQESDAADFFGREALTQRLLSRLGEGGDLARFLAVAGPSGSGKSSVVRAGVIPALRRGALPGSESWFITELVPGSNPVQEFEAALLRVAIQPSRGLMEHLHSDPRGLVRAVNTCLPEDPAVELVIVIDQFEELFTLVQQEATRAKLLENLVTATLDESSRLRILITLRADFVDRPLSYLDFGELIRQRTEFVLPLTAEELERAILNPAERVGLQIEPGLISAIVHDLNDQPGALPLLQYALTELFERREGNTVTKSAYQSIGGAFGALGRRAEEVFNSLPPAGQAMARQIFLRLVTLGEGSEDTRRRVPRMELESLVSPVDRERRSAAEEITIVLEPFGRARLLTFDRDVLTREPTVEIAHEALLRAWGRLRDWLAGSREAVRLLRQLNQATQEWKHAQKDSSFLATGMRLTRFESLMTEFDLALNTEEQTYLQTSIAAREQQASEKQAQQARLQRLQRWINVILTISVLVMASLLIFSFVSRMEALAQAQLALSRQLAAQALAEVQKPVGNDELAALLAVRSLNIQYDPVADAALVEAASRLPLKVFRGHDDAVSSVAISPDGKYVLTGSLDTSVRLWETGSGQQVRVFNGHAEAVLSVNFSPDGRYIISGSEGSTLKLWEVATGQEIYTVNTQAPAVFSAVFSPDGTYILTSGRDGPTQLWDATTGQEVRTFAHTGAPVVFSPDGQYILGSGDKSTAEILEVATGEETRLLGSDHYYGLYSVAFSPDGKYALAGSIDNIAILWEVSTGQELYTIRAHSSSVRSVAFSPDSRYLVTGSADRTARLWDVATGQEIRSWRGHMHRVTSVAFTADGNYIVTGSQDGTAKLWDITVAAERTLQGHGGELYSIAISSNGEYALTSSADTTAKMWDIGTGEEVRTFSGHGVLIHSAAFSPDARYALTGGEDGVVQVWDIATGQGVQTLLGHKEAVFDADFSPDGKYALTGGSDQTARLWDVSTGKEIRALRDHVAPVLAVAFSPDGAYLVTGGDDGMIRIWESASGRLVRTIQAPDIVYAAVFSPDGKYLLSGGPDTAATMWDVSTGAEIRTFTGHTNTVADVAFSPDGKYAVTASADRTAKLWEVTTGRQLRTLSGHASAVWGATFSPDGQYVWTASFDGTARRWEVDYRDFVADVCTRLLRDLTDEERLQAHITDQELSCPPSGR